MKNGSKRGDTIRWVSDIAYRGKGKRAKKLLAEADRHDKDAMSKKKAQRKHLQQLRGE